MSGEEDTDTETIQKYNANCIDVSPLLLKIFQFRDSLRLTHCLSSLDPICYSSSSCSHLLFAVSTPTTLQDLNSFCIAKLVLFAVKLLPATLI